MTQRSTWVLTGLLLTAGTVAAEATKPAAAATAATPAAVAASPATEMSEAEVRKVDAGAGKITLKHGDIKSLDMPPMTMVFHVKDPVLLDQVKAGDKVRFTAERIKGIFTVMTLERLP